MFVECGGNRDKVRSSAVLDPMSLEVAKDKTFEDATWVGRCWGYVKVQVHGFHKGFGCDGTISFELDGEVQKASTPCRFFNFPLQDSKLHRSFHVRGEVGEDVWG